MKNIKLETKTVTGVQESLQVPLIQIINDHPPFTGVTKYSMDLYSCLSINGIRTKLLQYIGGTNQHGYVFSDGINKYGFPIPLPYGHFIGILTGLNRKVKPLEISDNTVVHLSSPTLLQKNKMRVPSVLTVHDLIYKHNPSNSKIFTNFIEHQYKYIDQADIIFADSEYTKGEILKYFEVPPKKIVVVYNVFFKTDFYVTQDRSKEVESLRKSKESFILLHVGNDVPSKNLNKLYRTLSYLPENYKLVRVGLNTPQSINTVRKLNLNTRIRFIESISNVDLNKLYNSCDLFVYPSLIEGFGRPLVEAFLCGLPTIINNQATLTEISNGASLVYEESDELDLKEKIVSLATDNTLKTKLVLRGFEQAEKYSPSIICDIAIKGYLLAYSNFWNDK